MLILVFIFASCNHFIIIFVSICHPTLSFGSRFQEIDELSLVVLVAILEAKVDLSFAARPAELAEANFVAELLQANLDQD